MKKIHKFLLLVVFYGFTGGLYLYFSHIPTNNHFLTPLDKLVPTVPVFVVPYLLATFMFLAFPVFMLYKAKTRDFLSYLSTQALANLISFIIFFIYPTSVLRDAVTSNDFFSNILSYIHQVDRPSAAFPSGHVFESIIIGYFLWKLYPKTRVYVLVITPFVVASTILLKQHYLPDIVGGIIVAIISILVVKLFENRFNSTNP